MASDDRKIKTEPAPKKRCSAKEQEHSGCSFVQG